MDKKFISKLVNNSQERYIWYKEQLREIYTHSDIYPDWYKEYVRDLKNDESIWLKKLQDQSYWISQGFYI